MVCYFGSWSVYRVGNGKFNIEDIDPTLCTHLIYTFVLPTIEGGVEIIDVWADLPQNLDGYGKLNRVRNLGKGAKSLVALGGWENRLPEFSSISASESLSITFANNLVEFAKAYDFDGIDIDWEYPNKDNTRPDDKKNFVLLLQTLKRRLEEEGLLLTVALGASKFRVQESYEVAAISQHVDFINLMTYDLRGVWDKKTGINAPLKPGSWETGAERDNNVVRYLLYTLAL